MLSQLIPWLAPPLVGAFIGYLTNRIAIRMLFRPLAPWYLFGLRLPMTPGVIPAKRGELAKNIGVMVGSHLLTGEDIRRGLARQPVRERLLALVTGRLDDLLNLELGSRASLLPERLADDVNALIRISGRRLARFMSGMLERREMVDGLRWQLYALGNNFLARSLNQAMDAERRTAFFDFLEQSLHALLASPGLEEWLNRTIREKSDQWLAEKKSLLDLLPRSFIDLLHGLLERQTPHLLEKAAEFLGEPATRDRLIGAIRQGIDHFIASLGPLAAMAANFLSGETIERKVREYLDSREDDIRQWLENPEVQQRLTVLLGERLDLILATPLVDLLDKIGEDKRREICEGLARQAAMALARPATAAALRTALEEYATSRGDHTLDELLREVLGRQGSQQSMETAMEAVLALIRSGETRRMAEKLLVFVLEDLRRRPVGRLSALVPARVRNSAGAALADYVGEILVQEVPLLMETLDIRRVVTDKVDSLDLLRLEELLLSIMEEQFKYINLFGGLLGFLIGCLNLFFLRFF